MIQNDYQRKVILFIAMSLDGYIADENGGIDWLCGQDQTAENPDTYAAFIQNIDAIVMGWKTYNQIITELSPQKWMYKGLTSYVVSHRLQPSTDEIKFTDRQPEELIRYLKKQNSDKNIWICGGAKIVSQLLCSDLIDEFYISVIPTILGKGIRLFYSEHQKIDLELIKSNNYNGIVELIYKRRKH